VPLGHYLGSAPYIPASLAVSLPLMGLVIALSTRRGGLLDNRYAEAMGQVSFSAYLVHWVVLQLFVIFPTIFHTGATGYHAIFAFTIDWVLAVLTTYAISCTSYRIIERPMIEMGNGLIHARRAQPAPSLVPPT
jgi:peptidoglycan/LPS O-acetylase OafA/YrhL